MRRSHTVVLALAAAALLAHPAGAAAKPGLHVTDLTGDANGVNSQSLGLPLPATSTSAASLKGADIAGIDVVTQFKGKGRTRKPAGFTFRIRFVGPLQQGVNVTVTAQSSMACGESNTVQLGYQDLGALQNGLAICQSAEPGGDSATIGVTELSADKTALTWTIDNVLRPGTQLSEISAGTSVFVLGVFDELATDKVFTYGR